MWTYGSEEILFWPFCDTFLISTRVPCDNCVIVANVQLQRKPAVPEFPQSTRHFAICKRVRHRNRISTKILTPEMTLWVGWRYKTFSIFRAAISVFSTAVAAVINWRRLLYFSLLLPVKSIPSPPSSKLNGPFSLDVNCSCKAARLPKHKCEKCFHDTFVIYPYIWEGCFSTLRCFYKEFLLQYLSLQFLLYLRRCDYVYFFRVVLIALRRNDKQRAVASVVLAFPPRLVAGCVTQFV